MNSREESHPTGISTFTIRFSQQHKPEIVKEYKSSFFLFIKMLIMTLLFY